MHVNCGVLGAPPPIDGLEKAAGQRQFLKLNWTENGLAKWLAEGGELGTNILAVRLYRPFRNSSRDESRYSALGLGWLAKDSSRTPSPI